MQCVDIGYIYCSDIMDVLSLDEMWGLFDCSVPYVSIRLGWIWKMDEAILVVFGLICL